MLGSLSSIDDATCTVEALLGSAEIYMVSALAAGECEIALNGNTDEPYLSLVIDAERRVSTALLFRYSAITFNAHRIHYDLVYAQQVEHYPGLVVHGPLQANLLAAEATAWKGRRPDRFGFRGVHPVFHDDGLHLRATRADAGGLDLCAVTAAGHVGMQAKAEWED